MSGPIIIHDDQLGDYAYISNSHNQILIRIYCTEINQSAWCPLLAVGDIQLGLGYY